MRRICICVLAVLCSFSLFGCGLWMDGEYVSIEPHSQQYVHMVTTDLVVSSYEQIVESLKKLVAEGLDTGIIFLDNMSADVARSYMETAVQDVLTTDPVSVYAVENIQYDVGQNSGRDAIGVTITYMKSRAELLRIHYVETMEQAETVIYDALKENSGSVTFRVDTYRETDFTSIVHNCAETNPEYVMECPTVMSAIYPESGESRLVELVFTYQTDHATLVQMQEIVYPVFFSAQLYVQSDSSPLEKYSRLYVFLMERSDYKLESSVTPAYSLLQDGIGDSGAFSSVYARMCNMAGLECYVVHGTRNGEPWIWNMVKAGESYAYVDLLRSRENRSFRLRSEAEMYEYTWDKESVWVSPITE